MEGSGGSTPMGTPMATPPTTVPGAPTSRGGGCRNTAACCAGGRLCPNSVGMAGTPGAVAGGGAAIMPGARCRPGSGSGGSSGGTGGCGDTAASSTAEKRERRFWAPDCRKKCFCAWEATWVGVRLGT